MKTVHIYFDEFSGGWIRQVLMLSGRWENVGHFGTKKAALKGK